jgi:hypothetical protein
VSGGEPPEDKLEKRNKGRAWWEWWMRIASDLSLESCSSFHR